MANGRKKLIFDTSGINALAKDSECLTIVAGLRSAYVVGVTETVISEIAADPEEERRVMLLDIVERLLKFGMCVYSFHVIIEADAKAHLADRDGHDWRRVNVRFPEAEGEIVRQEIVHRVSEQTRVTLRQWDKGFQKIFSDAKPAFQKLFEGSDGERPSLKAVTDRLLGEGGAHKEIAVNLFERGIGTRLTQEEAHDFIECCLPFKALLVALCFSQYDRCIRPERQEWMGRAGRLDIFSAVYLPYCRIFVTNDEGQWKALRAVGGDDWVGDGCAPVPGVQREVIRNRRRGAVGSVVVLRISNLCKYSLCAKTQLRACSRNVDVVVPENALGPCFCWGRWHFRGLKNNKKGLKCLQLPGKHETP